jgi:cold shock CspA family protein
MEIATKDDVIQEDNGPRVYGDVIGQCKWFADRLGYGFITVCDGPDRGKDIFVHHTSIKPLNNHFKTLRKGEYVHFTVITGDSGLHAGNVTGILGGALMCDFVPLRSPVPGNCGHGITTARAGRLR